jgi:hypothetical protein
MQWLELSEVPPEEELSTAKRFMNWKADILELNYWTFGLKMVAGVVRSDLTRKERAI